MPPVRWKNIVTAIFASGILILVSADAALSGDSSAADGWRPIIGNAKREPTFMDEITQYRNPSSIGADEGVKLEPPSIEAVPATVQPNPMKLPMHKHKAKPKIYGHSKQQQAYLMAAHGHHSSHIPISVSGGGQHHLRPFIKTHMSINGKRKRVPAVGAHSIKNEVFVPAPSSVLGAYQQFFNPPIKQRDTQSVTGQKLYPQFDFSGFAISNEGLLQQQGLGIQNNPGQQYILPGRNPVQNDINYFTSVSDDYTRNLVPPPRYKAQEEQTKTPGKQKEIGPHFIETIHTINQPQLVIGKYTSESQGPALPENIVVQLPPSKFNVPQQNTKPKGGDVRITKENVIPINFNNQYPLYQTTQSSNLHNARPYEVTEAKWSDPFFSTERSFYQQPIFEYNNPQNHQLPQVSEPQFEFALKPFLPTPYKPGDTVPTAPTQDDVSVIYTELNRKNQLKAQVPVQEISTHLPVVVSQEAITIKEDDPTTLPTPEATSHRMRNNQRRRRPVNRSRTTTTSSPAEAFGQDSSSEERRPLKRRPIRYRTTQATPVDTTPETVTIGRSRAKPQRNRLQPTRAEAQNEPTQKVYGSRYSAKPQQEYPISLENLFSGQKSDSSAQSYAVYENVDPSRESDESVESDTEEQPAIVTTESASYGEKETPRPSSTIGAPENEIDFTTLDPEKEPITVTPEEKIPETTLATTTPIVSSSETPTTTTVKTHRIRSRPIKYDNKNRPRFSVKEYRQRLNQYTSTTDNYKPTTESARVRFPNRSRKPLSSLLSQGDETTTERSKFIPKDPRHGGSANEETSAEPEKPPKATNTRLRPFGRYRSTTESPPTATTSPPIKTKVFSNLRRPPPLTLRNRIQNKFNRTWTEKPAKEDVTDSSETVLQSDSTTEFGMRMSEHDVASKNESAMLSQRVSDLTSSAKNDYNTPGIFKSVSPMSRRIPSYFTIATDDPILPIEAFFPNINKEKERE